MAVWSRKNIHVPYKAELYTDLAEYKAIKALAE